MTLWRTGRKVGRTIYVQTGDEPSDDDQLVGMMDTRELAALVVRAVNDHITRQVFRQHGRRDPRCRCAYEVDGRRLSPSCQVHP